jgi:hypothetical protein
MPYQDDLPNVEVGVEVSGSFDPAGQAEWSTANRYRLAGPCWEIYGDPDPWTGHFDVNVFWSLAAP